MRIIAWKPGGMSQFLSPRHPPGEIRIDSWGVGLDSHLRPYSHSIVDGGFDEMSSATRLTAEISLMIRLEIVSSRS